MPFTFTAPIRAIFEREDHHPPMRPIPVDWARKTVRHAEMKHGVTLDEIQVAASEQGAPFHRVGKRRYRVVAIGGGRLLTLFFDDMGDRYRFVTGRPATAKEKRLYRERTRGR